VVSRSIGNVNSPQILFGVEVYMGRANFYFAAIVKLGVQIFCVRVNILGIASGGGGGRKVIKQYCIDKL